MALSRLDEKLVYDLTKTMFENPPEVQYSSAKYISLENALKGVSCRCTSAPIATTAKPASRYPII